MFSSTQSPKQDQTPHNPPTEHAPHTSSRSIPTDTRTTTSRTTNTFPTRTRTYSLSNDPSPPYPLLPIHRQHKNHLPSKDQERSLSLRCIGKTHLNSLSNRASFPEHHTPPTGTTPPPPPPSPSTRPNPSPQNRRSARAPSVPAAHSSSKRSQQAVKALTAILPIGSAEEERALPSRTAAVCVRGPVWRRGDVYTRKRRKIVRMRK